MVTIRKQQVLLYGEASHWLPATMGVPLRSVLRPFNFYIDDLELRLKSYLLKFAVNTKVESRALASTGCKVIQMYLEHIFQRSKKSQMSFIVDKG